MGKVGAYSLGQGWLRQPTWAYLLQWVGNIDTVYVCVDAR